MKALITGASSGIGKDMALSCARRGIDLVLTGRNEQRLQKITEKVSKRVHAEYIVCDLSDEISCKDLYRMVEFQDIDILINNAGFGDCGDFISTDLDKELSMIRTNITAVHILTKLFVKDFVKRGNGYILNVASSAAFQPGPGMATYYATKSYVYRLTMALWEELRNRKSRVHVSVLCPGPVDTGFNDVANVKFSMPGMSSKEVAEYAIKNMLRGRLLILPGLTTKLVYAGERFVPEKLLMRAVHRIQRRKLG